MNRDFWTTILRSLGLVERPKNNREHITFDGGTRTDAVAVTSDLFDASALSSYPSAGPGSDLREAQATRLNALLTGGESDGDAASVAADHAAAGLDAPAFASGYAVGVDAAISATFDRLEHRLGDGNSAVVSELRRAEDELQRIVRTTMDDLEAGLSAYDSRPVDGGEDGDELNVDDEDLLDGIGESVFMLDADGGVVAWNNAMEGLTNLPRETVMGSRDAVHVFAGDGSDVSLAEKVIDAPRDAHVEHGVERVGTHGHTLYVEEGSFTTNEGQTYHVTHSAAPLFEGDELVAVVQTVRDRTDDLRRHEGISDLVGSLIGTMAAMGEGDLSARAEFADEHGVIDDELLSVVDQLNDLAEEFEGLTREVGSQTTQLADTVTTAATSVRTIEERIDEQNDLLRTVGMEMEQFSANMQEVAASSDQVASAAEQAKAAADSGLDSSAGAREATDDVIEMSDDLVETVTQLESQMDAIEDVVEVIAEVADQTNLLALNANIEAARAGEAGAGFEVVADEVKSLANETRTHTNEIATRIEDIQSQANETVVAVEESNEQIDRAGDEIEDALIALEEIADAVDEAATGVTEVAEANDEQAASVEQVMATVEDVREQAREAEVAIREVVEATMGQTEAIADLSESVNALTDDTTGLDEQDEMNDAVDDLTARTAGADR